MASRLYRTTSALYCTVERHLLGLGLAQLGSPTLLALVTLVVTGLVLLEARQTQTRIARFLPARAHDAHNRLLRTMPFSTRALMRLLMSFATSLGQEGYLVLDDVIIEKAYAKRLPWAGWTYSFAKKRKVYGLHIVVLIWCNDDRQWRIPVGFRWWRPARSCAAPAYRTKLELAAELVQAVVAAQIPVRYIVFDTAYTAGWFTKRLARLGLTWQGTLDPKTHVVWHGTKQSVGHLATTLPLKWRPQLRLRACAVEVYAPSYGVIRLCVTKNRHGNYEYLASNALTSDLTSMVGAKRSRWSVETVFRDTKQYGGLEACQCWTDAAWVRHVALVLLTFVVLQQLRQRPNESVGAVKERWHLATLQDGEAAPEPLRACPPELRGGAVPAPRRSRTDPLRGCPPDLRPRRDGPPTAGSRAAAPRSPARRRPPVSLPFSEPMPCAA
jgi:hypothetical protein